MSGCYCADLIGLFECDVCIDRKIITKLQKECDLLRAALESIAEDPFNCGCTPICRCHSQESLEITIEELRSTAHEALK